MVLAKDNGSLLVDAIMLDKVVACLKLSRPLNSMMIGLAVIVGAVIASSDQISNYDRLLAGFLAGSFTSAAIMAHNDIVDVDIDRVNAPWRPIPSGKISVSGAKWCLLLYSIGGIASSLYTGLLTLLMVVFALLFSIAYNSYGKKLGVLGNIQVSLMVMYPILYGGIVVGSVEASTIIISLMIFFSVLGREIAKDIADVEGDKLAGVKTIAVSKGPVFASRIAALMYLIAVSISIAPLVLGIVENKLLYAVVIGAIDVGFVYESLILAKQADRDLVLKHKNRVLLLMLAGLIALYLSLA